MPMRFMDDRVFAALLAVVVASSGLLFTYAVSPGHDDGFIGLVVLGEQGGFRRYVSHIVVGENVSLRLVVVNMRHTPLLAMVRYKVALNDTLPSPARPSPEPVIREWLVETPPRSNVSLSIVAPVAYTPPGFNGSLVLVFELWEYCSANDSWVYTGIWTHIHVVAEKPIIPP